MSCIYNIEFSAPVSFLANKKEDHRLSRYALSKIAGLDDLTIINHLYLKASPETKVSISHTKGAGAAAIDQGLETRSIGIDIEWNNRVIKPGVEKFFLHPDDEKLSTLKLWLIKEAAYKAYFPLYQDEKVLVLKDFAIKNNQFYFHDKPLGQFKIENKEHDNKVLFIALAWI